MARRETFLTTRRLAIASVVFGLFVVLNLALFAWLIFNTLSQREIDKVVLEEAQPLARELEKQARELEQEDLWVVMSVAQETQTYIQSVLSQREIVRKIEIRDRDGKKVYERVNTEELPVEGQLPLVDAVEGEGLEVGSPPAPLLREAEVAIGELGTLVIGLSEEEVQKRLAVLRRDLIQQASLIGILTITLLGLAYAAIWSLIRRSRQLEEQALEAERLAYVGTLASGLAHEIRSPLNSLNLNMQMLEEDARELGSAPGQVRLLAITRSEISRLERLVTDFLSYARPRPPELEEVPAVELLERVLEVLAGEIQERRAEVEIEDQSDGARVRVDRGQMGQLLLNLTQNALTATEECGRRPRIRLLVRRDGDQVALEVIDNGCGISEEERQRIFDLFYSTRKGGTGLGLAIAERIAKAHQATLEVDSTPGVGTTLRLVLPLTGDTAEPARGMLPGWSSTRG